jgi:hypothetical protein
MADCWQRCRSSTSLGDLPSRRERQAYTILLGDKRRAPLSCQPPAARRVAKTLGQDRYASLHARVPSGIGSDLWGAFDRRPGGPAETTSTGPLHAHLDGFDLHAAVAVPAGDRTRLEHLCRYILRPPIAQERLERAPDGAVLLRLRRPWTDGTRAIRFEPSEFLEKLAAMTPKPRQLTRLPWSLCATCAWPAGRRAHVRRPIRRRLRAAGGKPLSCRAGARRWGTDGCATRRWRRDP